MTTPRVSFASVTQGDVSRLLATISDKADRLSGLLADRDTFELGTFSDIVTSLEHLRQLDEDLTTKARYLLASVTAPAVTEGE